MIMSCLNHVHAALRHIDKPNPEHLSFAEWYYPMSTDTAIQLRPGLSDFIKQLSAFMEQLSNFSKTTTRRFENNYPTFKNNYPTIKKNYPTFENNYTTFKNNYPTFRNNYPTLQTTIPGHFASKTGFIATSPILIFCTLLLPYGQFGSKATIRNSLLSTS